MILHFVNTIGRPLYCSMLRVAQWTSVQALSNTTKINVMDRFHGETHEHVESQLSQIWLMVRARATSGAISRTIF